MAVKNMARDMGRDVGLESIGNNHPVEPEDLMAYLDGELSADRAAATMAHLERCTECQTVISDLRGVSQKLSAWEVEASSPRIAQTIAKELEGFQSKSIGDVKIVNQGFRTLFDLRHWPPQKWSVAIVSVAVVAILVVASIPMRRQRLMDETRSQSLSTAPARGRHLDKIDTMLVSPGDFTSSPAPVTSGPMIVRTASLTLTARQFDKARTSLDTILRQHNGYVGELNVSTPVGAGSTLTATLRVPADQLEAALTDLKGLGRVESESQSGQEVTAQYVDLEARLSNARNTEERLTDLLRQRTGKLSDVLAVETEISRVRGEIEQMEAEKKNLANQVTFATITATVREDYQAQLQVVPSTTFGRLRNAAVEGYRDMVDGVVGTALFVLSYGPSFLLWGCLLFFPARGVWRRLRRNLVQ
jgi:hypothetical protein